MTSLFAFRCATEQFPLPESTLVVFAGPNDFAYNDLTEAISDETDKALSPEWVCLIYPQDGIRKVSEELRNQTDALAPLAQDTIVALYVYNNAGAIELYETVQGEAAPGNLPLDSIRRQGLSTLFARRGGLLEAGPSAHFIKPSGNSDSRFLRASHALSEGAEIYFTAFWIMPHLTEEVRYIHLDTSSIASVAFAALLMKKAKRLPIIQTFQSYEGMKSHRFSKSRLELVIISASQSGNMAIEVANNVKDSNKIITLYSTNRSDTPGVVLCDLTVDPKVNPRGLKPRRKISDVRKSRPIKLISEHFVVEPEPPRAIVPALKHAPAIVKEVLSKLQGHDVFSSNRAGGAGSVPRGIWVDVEKLSETKIFQDWVERLVRRKIPAATRAIVLVERGPFADLLAKSILEEIGRCGGELKDIELVSLEMIEEQVATPRWPLEAMPIVVAGGATGHGTDLLAASRALRKWAPNSHRIYLSLATMPSSRKAFNFLEANLKQPSHEFLSLFELFVDRDRAGESWEQERRLLEDNEDQLPAALSVRLDALNAAAQGLTHNLFLPGKASDLQLRDNFAFWPAGTDCSKASHADVFVTVAAITSSMRSNEDLDVIDRLINDSQTHSVLSSGAFTRYNDGIIQAALLRAASPVELNYCDAPEHSRLISDLIVQMCDLVDRFQGEALSEFLLALALDRLTLADRDVERVTETLQLKMTTLSETQAWLAAQILELAPAHAQLSVSVTDAP